MSIYPSLEDMKATELIKAQMDAMKPVEIEVGYPAMQGQGQGQIYATTGVAVAYVYPSLHDFMGMELSEMMIRENMPEYLTARSEPGDAVARAQSNAVIPAGAANSNIVAPISGNKAVMKSMITHGVRQVNILKSTEKVGLRVRSMHTGVFACLITENGPAANAGLRFGDQILQIDGIDMAGFSDTKVHDIFKKKKIGDSILLAVRDRPFERTVTLVRDSTGHIGFQFKEGKIINIVKDSSAARNGLLTEHSLLEINGKNVIGLKDKEITKIISGQQGNALNVTIMPTFLYAHMVKVMHSSLFSKMDHSDI